MLNDLLSVLSLGLNNYDNVWVSIVDLTLYGALFQILLVFVLCCSWWQLWEGFQDLKSEMSKIEVLFLRCKDQNLCNNGVEHFVDFAIVSIGRVQVVHKLIVLLCNKSLEILRKIIEPRRCWKFNLVLANCQVLLMSTALWSANCCLPWKMIVAAFKRQLLFS